MAKVSSTLLKRRLDIAEIVRDKGEVKVDELSELLNVSGVTIRQDLNYLEQQGYLKRSFGGAIYLQPESSLSNKLNPHNNVPLMENIDIDLVQQCLGFIQDGDVVFLGHGSLVRKIIPHLYSKRDLTIIVNDLSHALMAKEFLATETIVAGGVISEQNTLVNLPALQQLLSDNPPSLFIGEIDGISSDNQLIIQDSHLVQSYQYIIEHAGQTIIMLPQRMATKSVLEADNNGICQLDDIDVAILSRAAMTEYHQQFLDNCFEQLSINKKSVIYHQRAEAK